MAVKNSRSDDNWPQENIDTAAEAALRRRKRHREWSGAILVLLIGLAGLLAGRLGILWSRFDLFAQFSIQFAILAFAGLVGLLVPRFKGKVAGLLTVMLIVAYGLLPDINFSNPDGQLVSGEKRLKAAQFNLGGERSTIAGVVASLQALDADVVSLVEVRAERADLISQLKTKYPFHVDCFDQQGCEMVIVSKFPLAQTNVIGAAGPVPMISASLGPELGGLLVIGLHTTRFPHISDQFRQFHAIAKSLEKQSGPILVMGDFNATPQSRVLREFAARLGLSVNTYLPSWPATYGLPQLAIDHILSSASLRVLSREEAGQSAGSDHIPVALVFGVAAQAQ